MGKKKVRKEVAFKDGIIREEELPLPFVHYPGFYGSFFGFSEKRNSEIILCACSLSAFENYLIYRRRGGHEDSNAIQEKKFIISSKQFPIGLTTFLLDNHINSENKIKQAIKFEEKICHECNKTVHSMRYCVDMYGGVFKQNYGWYIARQAIEYGCFKFDRFLKDKCPQEILDLMDIDPKDFQAEYQRLLNIDFEQANNYSKLYGIQQRKINRIFENEVRRKFGHKQVGEAWTSETILYFLVKQLYGENVIHHYRADFLQGLEIDIYVPHKKIAIEYQGIQHYKPIKYWGGESALKRCKERDAKKKRICKANDIKLVYFTYRDDLSIDIVQERLNQP